MNQDTLYRCTAGGPARAWPCTRGCVERDGGPETNDVCNCFPTGSYCGEDQVIGDKDSLYECRADFTGRLIRACPRGCTVRPGMDDICEP